MPASDDGLLFVYADLGPKVKEVDFNDWYDNEHAPARLTVPGFSTAGRYKAVDTQPPSWLALYDITSPEVIQSDAYKALSAQASSTEKEIISCLSTLSRRVYTRFATFESPTLSTDSFPSKFVLVVGFEPTRDREEEMNAWYANEHLELLSKVPGFLRARRYRLVSSVELAGNPDEKAKAPVPFPYLTLYEWETDAYATTPEFKDAISTPWSVKVMGELVRSELRLFALHKSFSK
ncbi:hypothetical protein Hypma_005732 [Hypsizygus marmoreus]|uniref:EthD domain-containing protein n=1 Tax=Hypsizygus marmoreus TaxID=39966 RepID=A0A369KA22_HYPMA|nr:hypothetical protein Hypma_005732 [Hypsizygus marmoreus]